MEILDALGRSVVVRTTWTQEGVIRIDFEGAPPGLYTPVAARNGQGTRTSRKCW